MRCDQCHDAINSYVDEELLPEEQREVREHLTDCPDCRREHEVLVATTRTLREGLLRHPAPDVLKARIRSALSSPDAVAPRVVPSRRSWIPLAAAGLLIAATSSVLTFAAMQQRSTAPTTEILASHIRSLMPGHLVDVASTDQHNVKPWFNGRLDLSPAVPRLDSIGFPLVGGRVDYVSGRSVAAVVYGRRQHVINVFSWPVTGAPAQSPRVTTEQGYHLVHWRRDGLDLWAVSDLNVPELTQFVTAFDRSDSASGRR